MRGRRRLCSTAGRHQLLQHKKVGDTGLFEDKPMLRWVNHLESLKMLHKLVPKRSFKNLTDCMGL